MAIEDAFRDLTATQRQAALEGPALMPPPGVTPNFINPPNQNKLGYGLIYSCAVVCAAVVCIRLYASLICRKKMNIEDYLAIVALGVTGGFLYISFRILLVPGLYVHQWNVQLKDLAMILFNVNNNYILYGIIIMLLKAAILLEWTHLFVPLGIRNGFWWTCHAILWANVMFYIACTVVENFSCAPREKIWNKLIEGHCVNNPALIMSSGILNMVSDVVIFALPQKMIWSLHISTRKRVGICLLFATGAFGCVCGAVRLVWTTKALGADDITFNVGPIGLWSVGELTSGFLVLCVPSFPKVFKDSIIARKLASLANRLSGATRSNGMSNLRHGLPSWYRPSAPRRPQRSQFSEIEEFTVPVTQPQSCMAYGDLPRDDSGTRGLGMVFKNAVSED
ncbi:uncharacterized protein CC84DRAFT_1260216 [Paraphaeosphaeria sporulosa]|uniref:Rhodopsin domain-containing protein n=1 Tax=Paraphaeosphaeria sporulosa TaxID=1460663 RepID=A0A177CCM7_9PLEO|nr:uncharacterized protein CC84DRAFT_1260216 [Paraphaeosphaeria sporulosa]OAG04931.1 hypothetical protein CC84DRAFT_1260216 [Paraphaeosphaeria sporulosa]